MHNILSDMDLQTRPLKPAETRFHFLAMTSSPDGRSLCVAWQEQNAHFPDEPQISPAIRRFADPRSSRTI